LYSNCIEVPPVAKVRLPRRSWLKLGWSRPEVSWLRAFTLAVVVPPVALLVLVARFPAASYG
jgi:hypothetical protein